MSLAGPDGVDPADWCRRCGTKHASGSPCPTAVDVVAPETPRWRVGVLTPTGIRGYGVLVAPAVDGWRARIVTLPSILWMVPGGGVTMKFFARSENRAVRDAVSFVRNHCVVHGYVMRDELDLAPPGRSPVALADVHQTGGAAPRFERRYRARFGRSRPSVLAVTANVSESGLFVATDQPMAVGESLGITLELEHGRVPLRGSVIWNRPVREGERDSGMGIRLVESPPMYVSYVRALG